MAVTDEIKARLDIVDYIQKYVPLKRGGRTWKAACPFHAENTPSFVVDPERQTWRCFGACSTGGDVIEFAMKQNGWSFGETLQELGKLTGVEVKSRSPQQRQQDEQLDKLRGLLEQAAHTYHIGLTGSSEPNAQAALRYLRENRGLTDETIKSFNLGYARPGWDNLLDTLKKMGYTEDQIVETGMAIRAEGGKVYDRFRNRLMIPIRDDRGRVIGFGARALDPGDNPKYLNSPQTPLFDKSRTVYGLDMAKRTIADTDTAVVVEGYMDVIQAHQCGFRNVVAQMGTALTETQIARLPSRIVLALDGDSAGQQATHHALEHLARSERDVRIAQMPDGVDPDSLLRDAPDHWSSFIDEAEPLPEYIITTAMQELSAQATVPERFALAKKLIPILVACESDVLRKANVQMLALHLQLPERELLAITPEKNRPQSVAASAPQAAVGIELNLICSMLADSTYLPMASRELRTLEQTAPNAQDFTGWGWLFELTQAALNQWEEEPLDYLKPRIDGVAWDALVAADCLPQSVFLDALLRLRLDQLSHLSEYALAESNMDTARQGVRARALLNARRVELNRQVS